MTKNVSDIFCIVSVKMRNSVARLLAKIYYKLGLLNDNFVEIDGRGLVEGYSGQTASKTHRVIDSAMGGVLFIDEAYNMINGQQDSFGKEAVATLMKVAEDRKGDFMLILAGYEDEMMELLGQNIGMDRRFPNKLHFESYTPEELYEIFLLMLQWHQYQLEEGSRETFLKLLEVRKDSLAAGNAGAVENILLEEIVPVMARRLAQIESPDKQELTLILRSDIELYKKLEETRSGEKLDEVSFFCCLYRACDEVDDRYARFKKSHLLEHYVRMGTADAFDFTKRAAEHGCTDMYWFLAGKYRDGRGCSRSYEKAAECYLLSGNTQDAEQMKRLFRLEQSYERAEELLNTDQFEQAIETIQRVSIGGLPKAQYKMAELYEKGYRIRQSDEMALRWYRKAADGYDQPAVRRMIEVYRYGELGENVSDFQVLKYEARLQK